jgi:hypothetical protein
MGRCSSSPGEGAHYDVFDPGGIDNEGFDDFVHPGHGLRGPTPKDQDFGAYRSQMINTLAGKICAWTRDRARPRLEPVLRRRPREQRLARVGPRHAQPVPRRAAPNTGASDPALADPGTLIFGDVGRSTWEELNVCHGGENFGWPLQRRPRPALPLQGLRPAGHRSGPCSLPPIGALTGPIVVWNHSNPALYQPAGSYKMDDGTPIPGGFLGVCTAGGAPYAGGAYPDEYDGRFFFADYGLAGSRPPELDESLSVVALHPFYQAPASVTAIGRHPLTGDIYFASNGSGKLTKIRYVDPTP